MRALPVLPLPAAIVGAVLAALLAQAASAQTPPRTGAGIYTCIDERGRRLTSDRPIPECTAKEQQLLNRDGSVRQVIPPTLTPEERAVKEAQDRRAAEARAAQQDAVRRDRNLLMRYPDEAAHQRARQAALEPMRTAIRNTDKRLTDLARERVPLMNETEFYVGKPLPPKLRTALDANDAAADAQRAARVTHQTELARVTALFDAELERLRKLWGGAPAGSLGPLPQGADVSARAAAAAASAAAQR
jgi:rRNA-processing protein FCF1